MHVVVIVSCTGNITLVATHFLPVWSAGYPSLTDALFDLRCISLGLLLPFRILNLLRRWGTTACWRFTTVSDALAFVIQMKTATATKTTIATSTAGQIRSRAVVRTAQFHLRVQSLRLLDYFFELAFWQNVLLASHVGVKRLRRRWWRGRDFSGISQSFPIQFGARVPWVARIRLARVTVLCAALAHCRFAVHLGILPHHAHTHRLREVQLEHTSGWELYRRWMHVKVTLPAVQRVFDATNTVCAMFVQSWLVQVPLRVPQRWIPRAGRRCLEWWIVYAID